MDRFRSGGSSSLSATCTMWANGRTEFHAALPATPTLEQRGSADGCGGLYVQARNRSELRTYAGKVTPIRDFLAAVIHDLAGVDIVSGGSDQYRRSEVEQVLDDPQTGADFGWNFRRMGSGPQGSNDVRAFQRFLLKGGDQDDREFAFSVTAYRRRPLHEMEMETPRCFDPVEVELILSARRFWRRVCGRRRATTPSSASVRGR